MILKGVSIQNPVRETYQSGIFHKQKKFFRKF